MREERVARPRKERADTATPELKTDGELPTSPVLLLQRQVGNRAVGSLLSREAKEDAATATIILPEPIGVLLVDAYRMASAGEVWVSIPSSAKDAELFKAAKDGKALGDVVISTRGLNIRIADAVIASLSVTSHGPWSEISLTLAGTVAVTEPEDKPKGGVDSGSNP